MTTEDHLWRECAFLLDRLIEFERAHVSGLDGEREDAYQDWSGNVVPSIERVRLLLVNPPGAKDESAT